MEVNSHNEPVIYLVRSLKPKSGNPRIWQFEQTLTPIVSWHFPAFVIVVQDAVDANTKTNSYPIFCVSYIYKRLSKELHSPHNVRLVESTRITL